MLTCLLLILSSSLFAVQFCINKFFQLYKPPGNASSALFALFGKVAAVVVFFFCVLLSGTTFWENGYTVLAGVAQAFLNLAVTVIGVYALNIGSVGMYTVSMMIGGMAVPAVFGACFLGEKVTVTRVAAFFLIAVAIVLSAKGEKKKLTRKAVLFYAALFFCNGFMGVFTALHTNIWGKDVNDFTFMFVTSTAAAVCYLPAWLFLRRKEIRRTETATVSPLDSTLSPRRKTLYFLLPFLFGVLNGVANLFIVVGTADAAIGSVVSFPLVTGGTILFTSLLSHLLYGEKTDWKTLVGNALIMVALIIFVL
ncbi:MAG: hypothetical protein IIX02_07360 [Clostridia bacterium]|nr:hypothetical protein [Clostridia bacterium]